ncbi:MAG: LysR family transcriptional regulator, partial [Roseococcus sp.]
MLPAGLDPELLRSFVLIAEGGSVTRAAERVGRTQSAVSMQMKRLEEVLGVPVLRRGPRGLEPTDKGLWLLE